MHVYVITGASSGLGAAIADRLLAPGVRLLGIARRDNPDLAKAAAERGAQLDQWRLDLAQAPAVATRLQAWLRALPACESATLINNAGALGRVGPVDENDDAALSAVLRVDIEAPIMLAAAFLRATRSWTVPRRVLNISSGAGRNAYAGWAVYCAAKAALDHFSRAAALDESRRPGGARIVSLAPGVIDTPMQAQLRGADEADFPDRQRFVDLHRRGELATPAAAAERVIAYLARADFGVKPVADVRDA
jgi:NAD(P)-dependent dehydrogenase (short-subunit alcohol dehydrogenase family)